MRLFRHRLTGIDGIQEGDISRLCDQLRRSQLASVKTRSTQVAGRDDASFVASAANSMDVRPPQQRSRKVTAPNDIDLLRAVIADAISHADYDTLAKVTLPAGLMFDTFRQRALKGEI